MNLITNLKSWFLPWNARKDNTTNDTTNTNDTTTASSSASAYEQ